MKKLLSLMGIMILAIILGVIYAEKKDQQSLLQKSAVTFWLISDPHYIDKSLTDSGAAFKEIKQTAAGKELDYQKESLQAFIAKAQKEKPDMLIITGDLTLNGEKVSAEKLAELLKELTVQGIKVFVIPGNHDINDGWARKFVGEKQEAADAISTEAFKKIFAACGYENSSSDPNSLSYAVSVNDTYNFLFLDTNIYPEDNQKLTRPSTGGTIRGKTLTWMKNQLAESQAAKKKTLVFMHHNLYKHNELLTNGYVLNNAAEVRNLLAEYQVPAVFSGHIHAQDIMTETTAGQPITEIISSSFAIAPQSYGVVKLTNQAIVYKKQQNDVDKWAQNKNILPTGMNYAEYMKKVLTEDGKRLGYAQLSAAGLTDQQQIETGAAFVGKMNERFFAGNDFSTGQEVATLKQEKGYQIIAENSPFLKEYIDSIIQDKNEPDNQWQISF
ncbi:metallophosphoesterase [Erwinia sp. CPCC 100877]|nr:metallophosphoesterase [Erwinia sp. CPCC 100877]